MHDTTNAIREPQRSPVQSQWPSLVFYGAPHWDKMRNQAHEEDTLTRLLGNGSDIAAWTAEAIILSNGARVMPSATDKQSARQSATVEARVGEYKAEIDDGVTLHFAGRKFAASGRLTADGFLILKGSRVNPISASFQNDTTYYPRRKELEDNGTIADGIFTVDFIVKNAQMAASVVASRAADARADWKTDDGRTYGDLHPKARRETTAATAQHTTGRRITSRPHADFKNFRRLERIDGVTIERHLTERDGATVLMEYRH